MASHVDETTLNNTEIYTTPRDAARFGPASDDTAPVTLP